MGKKFLVFSLFVAVCLILLGAFIYLTFLSANSARRSSSTAKTNQDTTSTVGQNQKSTQAGFALVEKWVGLARGDSGDLSIQFIDLTDNQALGYEEKKIFPGASVNKLITAGYLLDQFDKGKLDLREELGGSTLQEHAKLMINQSDNESWDALNKRLGFANIESFARSLGLSDFKAETNEISASDIGIFLEKLYKGQILTEASKQLLYSWMRNTETEDRITVGLPPGVMFYHKSGTFDKGVHDAAIIIHPQRPFVLVVLTNGLKDGRAAISQITRDVWQYADDK